MMTDYGRVLDQVGQLGLVLLAVALVGAGFAALVALAWGGRRPRPPESDTLTPPEGPACDRSCPGSPPSCPRSPP